MNRPCRFWGVFFCSCLLISLGLCFSPVAVSESGTHVLNSDSRSLRGSRQSAIVQAQTPVETFVEPLEVWRRAVDDPRFSMLLNEAMYSAFDIRQARARLTEARASLRASKAGLFPSLNLVANFSDNENNLDIRTNQDSLVGEVGVRGRWSPDLFGAANKQVDAVEIGVVIAEAQLKDARRLIAAQITSSWIELKIVRAQKRLAATSEARLEEAVEKLERMAKAGYVTAFDISRALRQLYEARATQYPLTARESELIHAIANLSGVSPLRVTVLAAGRRDVPVLGLAVPRTTPLRVLAGRPDLSAAFFEVLAARSQLSASERALLPSFDLTFDAVSQGTDEDLFRFDEIATDAILSIAMPLLGRGRLLAQIDIDDARLEAAEINFERTSMAALSEMDTSLVRLNALRAALVERENAAEIAAQALDQSQRLFSVGEVGYLDVLLAEQSRIDADSAALEAMRQASLAWTACMVAMAQDAPVDEDEALDDLDDVKWLQGPSSRAKCRRCFVGPLS